MVVTETTPETRTRQSGRRLGVFLGLLVAASTFVGIGALSEPGLTRQPHLGGTSRSLGMISDWVENHNSGQLDAWIGLYAEDAVVNGTLLKLDPGYIREVQMMNISLNEAMTVSGCAAVGLDVFRCDYRRTNDLLARAGLQATGLIEFGFEESGLMRRSDLTDVNPEVTAFERALSEWLEAEHPEIDLATRFGQISIADVSDHVLGLVEEFVDRSDMYPLIG